MLERVGAADVAPIPVRVWPSSVPVIRMRAAGRRTATTLIHVPRYLFAMNISVRSSGRTAPSEEL